jgi:hypothetical protein
MFKQSVSRFPVKMGEIRAKNADKKCNVKIFTKYENVKCNNENDKIQNIIGKLSVYVIFL